MADLRCGICGEIIIPNIPGNQDKFNRVHNECNDQFYSGSISSADPKKNNEEE